METVKRCMLCVLGRRSGVLKLRCGNMLTIYNNENKNNDSGNASGNDDDDDDVNKTFIHLRCRPTDVRVKLFLGAEELTLN